jgi:hypothetical protein
MGSPSTTLLNGKLYKRTTGDEIYYYDQNQLRFINDANTLNGVFNGVIYNSSKLDPLINAAPSGPPIVFGSLVGYGQNSPTAYFIDQLNDGVRKRAISDMAVFGACSFHKAMEVPFLMLQGLADGPAINSGYDDDGNPVR